MILRGAVAEGSECSDQENVGSARSDTAAIVFVVSTLGQARSATALIRTRGIGHRALAVVLRHDYNHHQGEAISKLLADGGVAHLTLGLPKYPTKRFPWNVRAIARTYRNLFEELSPAAIWVANRTAHYPLLCALARQRGVSLNYFEDGMNTYIPPSSWQKTALTITDFPFTLAGRIRNAVRFHTRMPDGSRRGWPGAMMRIVRSALAATLHTVFDLRIASAMDFLGGKRDMQVFGTVWNDFDEVMVVFPDRLSSLGILSRKTGTLDLAQAYDISASAAEELGHLPRSMFISQPYGDRSAVYYGAVAQLLSQHVSGELLVKPHPRESAAERALFLRLLTSHGVACRVSEAHLHVPAESMLKSGHFDEIIGVASSVLIYAHQFDASVSITCLASKMQNLLADSLVNDERFSELAVHLQEIRRWLEEPQ